MNTELREKAQNWLEDSEQLGRNIWLAGLGVYGKSLEEAKQLEQHSTSLFDTLVEEGRAVEAETRNTIDRQVGNANRGVEQRVQALFSRLSGIDPQRIDGLNDKIDQLTDAVAVLAKDAKAKE
ncbi:phasin family protein [Ferrimonas pelagia]|uniref:Poly(Hydroxyalkanoate) granule-associated protein n=1 Tax=Ferrimonas pelagia TaxID=1177826 RepID=A0ABP9FGV1_9GAMM